MGTTSLKIVLHFQLFCVNQRLEIQYLILENNIFVNILIQLPLVRHL